MTVFLYIFLVCWVTRVYPNPRHIFFAWNVFSTFKGELWNIIFTEKECLLFVECHRFIMVYCIYLIGIYFVNILCWEFRSFDLVHTWLIVFRSLCLRWIVILLLTEDPSERWNMTYQLNYTLPCNAFVYLFSPFMGLWNLFKK